MVEKTKPCKTEIAQIMRNDLANIDFDFNFDDIGESRLESSGTALKGGKLTEEVKTFLTKEIRDANQESIDELIACFFENGKSVNEPGALEVFQKMDELGFFGDTLILKGLNFNAKAEINEYVSEKKVATIDKSAFGEILLRVKMDPISEQAAVHLNNPSQVIENCELKIKELKLTPFLYRYVTSELLSTKSFMEIHENINKFYSKMSRLNLWKEVNITLEPGSLQNCLNYSIDLKRKSSYFASASQYIDPYNGAVVNVKGGYRNLLGFAEKLTVEYDKALYESRKTTYNLLIEFPTLPLGNKLFSFSSGYIYGINPLDRNIEQRTESRFLRFYNEKGTSSLSVDHSMRTNTLNNNRCCTEYLNDEVIPSKKFSLKLNKMHSNTFEMKSNKHRGGMLNTSYELALPIFGDVHFFKTELKQRKIFKLRPIRKIWKRAYKNWRLEENFSLGLIKSYKKNESLKMNDKFILYNNRGFLELGDRYPPKISNEEEVNSNIGRNQLWEENRMGDHSGTDFYIKNSYKLNIYDYPYFKKGFVYPFFHFSGFYLRSLKNDNGQDLLKRLRSEVRAVSGIGLAFEIGSGARIELLYNFFHLRQAGDREARFQFKVTLDD